MKVMRDFGWVCVVCNILIGAYSMYEGLWEGIFSWIFAAIAAWLLSYPQKH